MKKLTLILKQQDQKVMMEAIFKILKLYSICSLAFDVQSFDIVLLKMFNASKW
jgi:hypothetical protein